MSIIRKVEPDMSIEDIKYRMGSCFNIIVLIRMNRKIIDDHRVYLLHY